MLRPEVCIISPVCNTELIHRVLLSEPYSILRVQQCSSTCKQNIVQRNVKVDKNNKYLCYLIVSPPWKLCWPVYLYCFIAKKKYLCTAQFPWSSTIAIYLIYITILVCLYSNNKVKCLIWSVTSFRVWWLSQAHT